MSALASNTMVSAPPDTASRRLYLTLLTWSFNGFSSVRILAYLPTLVALIESGDSSQHSLWTWITWLGANLSMSGWLYEQNGRRWSRASAVSFCNGMMCASVVLTIAVLRWA